MASSAATTTAMGTSRLRPIARLEPPRAATNRISSVAYAVDDSASEEKTASAIVFERRCSSIWVVAKGRPTTNRLKSFSIPDHLAAVGPELSLLDDPRNVVG